MPAELVWTPQAREDLIEIYTYIGLDNPSAAERIFDTIQSKAELLIEYPRIGVRRPDLRSSARILIQAPISSFTRPTPIQTKAPSMLSKSFESSTDAAT